MSIDVMEQQAERCIALAFQCKNRAAAKFLRKLAVDLMLAANEGRAGEGRKGRNAATAEPAPSTAPVESPEVAAAARGLSTDLERELRSLGAMVRAEPQPG